MIMFREDLEDQGLSKDDLERQIAEHRAKLVEAAEKVPVKEPAQAKETAGSKRKRASDKSKDGTSKGKEHDSGKAGSKSSRCAAMTTLLPCVQVQLTLRSALCM